VVRERRSGREVWDDVANRADELLPRASRCGATVEEGRGARRSAPCRRTKDVGGQTRKRFPGRWCGVRSEPGRCVACGISGTSPMQVRTDRLSAPTIRRSLVPLGAETKLLAPRQRLPVLISTPYAIEGPAHAAHPLSRPENAFLARPAGSRAGSPRRTSRETGAADPRRSAATPAPSLEIDVGTPADSPHGEVDEGRIGR
jgi:hypothetical protein